MYKPHLTFPGLDESFGTLLSPVTGCLIVLILLFTVLLRERFMLVWVTSSSFCLSSFFLLQHPDHLIEFGIFGKVWPTTEKAWEARRNSAEQNPQQGKEHSAADKAGTDEFELQCLESLVPDADEGDDEADADHAQTHVEDDIGAPAPLEFLRMRPGCEGSSFALFASGNLIGKV